MVAKNGAKVAEHGTSTLYALQQRASIHNLNVAVFLECKSQIS